MLICLRRIFAARRQVIHEELIRSRRSRETVYSGPLGPHIDGFLTAVSTIGYTSSSLRDLANGAVQFSRYLTSTGVVDASTLCDQVVEGFVATQPARRCRDLYRIRCGRGIRAAHHLLQYLRSIGVTPPEAVPEYAYSWVLMEWLAFLRNHRGLKPNSLDVYRRLVEPFLQDLDGNAAPDHFAALTPDCVRRHVQRRARTLARSTRKNLVIALRSLLGFAFGRGYLARNLMNALERVPCFSLDRLPRGPKWDELEKLLTTIDCSTLRGRRDYAVLMVLITYGVRAGQLVSLHLEDVHWREGTIVFPAVKGGRSIKDPLTPAVGRALATYLRERRPEAPTRQVFLSLDPPFLPLAAGSVYNIVSRAFKRARIDSPHRGSHAIRHAWATHAMAQGQSLKTIADFLGHRSLETTRIYTKVDSEQLRSVCLPWPCEVQP